MRKKRLPATTLMVALAATVSACDTDPGAQVAQRDVYTGPQAFENCVADWGNADLCNKRLTAEEAKKMAEAQRQAGGPNLLMIPYSSGYGYYGPSYSGAERSTVVNGQTYRPALNRSRQVAQFSGPASPGMKPSGWSKPRAMGVTTTSRPISVTSRGGFGATGRGFSGGG